MAHRKKKAWQVRINSGQVDLSHSLPQGQAENFFFVLPCTHKVTNNVSWLSNAVAHDISYTRKTSICLSVSNLQLDHNASHGCIHNALWPLWVHNYVLQEFFCTWKNCLLFSILVSENGILEKLNAKTLGAKIVAITILYPSTAVRMPVYDSRILSVPFELWLNLYKNLVVF